MASHSLTHDGAERLLHASEAVAHGVGPVPRVRPLALIVLTGAVTALAVVASHVVQPLFEGGFAGEWLSMWALAAAATFVLGRAANGAATAILRGLAAFDRQRAEQAFADELARDPRLQADLRAARLNAERLADLGRAK